MFGLSNGFWDARWSALDSLSTASTTRAKPSVATQSNAPCSGPMVRRHARVRRERDAATNRSPPLRARRDDIPLLLDHYLRLYERKYDRPERQVPADVMEALVKHDWPGNVRALRHAAER